MVKVFPGFSVNLCSWGRLVEHIGLSVVSVLLNASVNELTITRSLAFKSAHLQTAVQLWRLRVTLVLECSHCKYLTFLE